MSSHTDWEGVLNSWLYGDSLTSASFHQRLHTLLCQGSCCYNTSFVWFLSFLRLRLKRNKKRGGRQWASELLAGTWRITFKTGEWITAWAELFGFLFHGSTDLLMSHAKKAEKNIDWTGRLKGSTVLFPDIFEVLDVLKQPRFDTMPE